MYRPSVFELATASVVIALWLFNLPGAHAAGAYEACAQRCVDNNYSTDEAGSLKYGSCINACPPYVDPLGTVYSGDVFAICLDPTSAACQSIPMDPNTEVPTPPGWTDPDSPPGTAPGESEWTCSYSSTTVHGPNKAACCSALQGADSVSFGSGWTQVTPGATGNCTWNAGGGNFNLGGASSGTSCPDGYSSSGGSCVLSNPSQVKKPSDGNCGVTRVGDVFTTDPKDPDCDDPADGFDITVDGNHMTVTRDDGVKIEAEIDEGTHRTNVRISKPTSDGNTDYVQYDVNGPSGPNPLTVQGTSVGTNMGSGTGEGEGMVCPGCAKESTQLANRALLDELVNSNVDTSGTSAALDAAATARTDAIEALGESPSHGISLSFSPLWPEPSCEIPDFTVAGHTMDTGAWCGKIDILRQLIGFALYVMTAMTLYSIFTRPGGA